MRFSIHLVWCWAILLLGQNLSAGEIVLQFSDDFPPVPKQRIEQLIAQKRDNNSPGTVVLSFGDNDTSRRVISPAELAQLGSEGFIVRGQTNGSERIFAAWGNPNSDKNVVHGVQRNIGDLFAAYSLLEQLGFSFLHPLEPTLPTELVFPDELNLREKPHWPIRTWHLHTQHPLELTDLLNGWGPKGPEDKAGWTAGLSEWDRFLEWCIANRQNRVEWFLLMAASWQEFADGKERQNRLRKLVDMGHQWGIAVGIDAPIVFRQQHAWTMIRKRNENEERQIREAVDWLHQAGFDFFEIEMGFSEFTHPTGEQMIDWMEQVVRYADEKYGKRTYVKVHCSQHQKAEGFKDPETGEPLNFNFLPYYADSRLGVLPHTVQFYSLTDPALTYGNKNFHEIRRYMQMEAGRREVLWYPETAYWVHYDINVPLFLPIYAQRRLYDLRLIAMDEEQGKMGRGEFAGSRIQGQVNFSSGWEWGYWINDVVTARAVWNPHVELSEQQALDKALEPIIRPMGEAGQAVKDLLVKMIHLQSDLLIHGKVAGKTPKDYEKRIGIAYLQGFETTMELSRLADAMMVCPRKKDFLQMRDPLSLPRYDSEIKPLLQEMDREFSLLALQFEGLGGQVAPDGRKLYEELLDATRITALRAKQVYNLYDMVDEIMDNILNPKSIGKAPQRLAEARRSLDKAVVIVARQEQRYRVDAERIAAWRYNPTAYHYGYLWTARSLVYWWRDEGKALDAPLNPGYLNFIDPIDIANGEGEWIVDDEIPIIGGLNITQLRKLLIDIFGNDHFLTEMLVEPESELQFPQGDLRERPEWCPEW